MVWALQGVAGFTEDEAIRGVCGVTGLDASDWATTVADHSWFFGDARGFSRERIEALWNDRFARVTKVYLDEDAWHAPLWQLWLRNTKMVFAANLSFLIQRGGRGTVVRLAQFLGRSKTTASKWGRWQEEGERVRVPPSTTHNQILEFFGLPASCDLNQQPIFLGGAEVRDRLLRVEGKHYLDCLSGSHLSQAVTSLREESARYAVKRLDTDKR